MGNIKKKILSLILILAMVLTMFPVNSGIETVEAADTTGSISFEYRYGTSTLIQVNTNLPATTPIVDFTTNQNGCSIDESGNTVQWVGWISMADADGTIVLTFNFGNAFTAGQTYVLPKGAVFGFTDGNTYALDGDYTFTFDGSDWTMNVENNVKTCSVISFGGGSTYLQPVLDIPYAEGVTLSESSSIKDENSTATLDTSKWGGLFPSESNTLVSINLSAEEGNTYVWEKGSVFVLSNGKSYELDSTYVFTFSGTSWTMAKTASVISFNGANNYLQPVLDIPYVEGITLLESSSIKDENSTVTLNASKWGGLFPSGSNTLVSINLSAEEDETYIWGKGSTFVLSNGDSYVLEKTYVFTYQSSTWTMESFDETEIVAERELAVPTVYGDVMQFGNFYDFGLSSQGTLSFEGTVLLDGEEVTVDGSTVRFDGYHNTTTIALYISDFTNKVLTIEAGSVISYNGVGVRISKTFNAKYDGTNWEIIPVIVAERELAVPTVYGDVMQFGNFYDFGLSSQGTLSFEGTVLLDGEEVTVDGSAVRFDGYSGTTTIALYISDFTNKVLTIEAGSVISYNGVGVRISKTFNAKYDGTNWEIIPVIVAERELAAPTVYGDVMQFGNFYDFGLSSQGTLSFEGTVLLDGEEVTVDGSAVRFDGYSGTTTIALYISDFTNKVLTIEAGSVISYNGVGVRISKTFNAKYDGSAWTEVEYIPNSEVEGDVNGDKTVDSRDLIRLKKVVDKAKDANNQCDLDLNEKYNGVDVHYLRLIILYGSISNLDVLDPLLYMGGEEFVSFADLPVDATDTSKIEEFKALGFNTSLLTEDHASISYSVTLDKSETAEIELGDGEQLLELTHTQHTNDGKMIQIQTNLPSDKTYSDFLLGDGGHVLDVVSDNTIGYFQLWKDSSSNIVYFNPMYNSSCDNGDQYILKAGSKLNVGGVYYVLDRTYTFTIQNEYLASIQNLDKAGLNVWIRNYSNQAGYFTDYMTNLLALHKDKIDGFYIIDEPFATTELYKYSKENISASEITDSFENINFDLVPWFNANYADTYFHINHVPMSSYNHYGAVGDTQADPTKYSAFFETYVNDVLSKVTTTDEKKTIGFDYYPLGYTEVEKILWWESTNFVSTGIAPNYLINMLIPAQKAKESSATFSTCIQTFDQTLSGETREVTTAAEVSVQLYTAMACGADMFEYFTYNSYDDGNGIAFNGILDINGNQTELYNEVKTANANAFSFADVINVFDWQGAQVSNGTSTNKNATGIATVQNSELNLLLDDSSNGVLSSVSSTDDAVVGYYTKGSQAGYMVANYNDPKLVTTDNSVTLTFDGCTKARVYTAKDGELTSEVVDLTDGSYTCEVAPGDGCFIIPVNAE